MTDGTFLLGPGAQKSGTTWLSTYIKRFPHVDTGMVKEYHIWDAARVPDCARFRITFGKVLRARTSRDFQRWRMQRSPEAYFDHFARLLRQPGCRLTADVTPTYSALGAADFAELRQGFERRGIDVKVVFLMRDPFERCWSAVRHYKRTRRSEDGVDISLSDEEALLAYLRNSNSRIRTDYHRTIRNLETAFAQDALFYGIFEELFRPESLARLAAFLDVPVAMDHLDTAVNTTVKQQSVSEDTIRAAAETFRDVYTFCADRFPQTRDLWLGNRYLA